MTTICGVVDGDTVVFGADSAASCRETMEIYNVAEPKVFACGPYLFGVCTSYRVAQLIRYKTALPDPPPSDDLQPFLVRDLVPAITAVLDAEGFLSPGPLVLGERTCILVGCRGRIWHIGPDLTVLPEGAFAAIGSGRIRAYSALHALESASLGDARERLQIALETAAAFTTTVRPPWHFVSSSGQSALSDPANLTAAARQWPAYEPFDAVRQGESSV